MLLSVKLMLLYCLLFFKHHVTSFSQLPEIPSTIPRQERENSGRCQDSERTLNSITKCLENFDRCLEGMDVRSEFENCISTPLSLECPRKSNQIFINTRRVRNSALRTLNYFFRVCFALGHHSNCM